MAITASFSTHILTLLGDSLDNDILLGRDPAGTLLANGGAIPVLGGTSTTLNTSLIVAYGLGGADAITIDETNGAMPDVQFYGGGGDDALTGGSGKDQLFGQAGNDTLNGKAGQDFLYGGAGNDTLTGGDGSDQIYGQSGNDRMVWNPGDDSDIWEGGADTDTAEINAGNGAEVFSIAANGTRVQFDRVSPAAFSLDIGTTENLVLRANGGDDQITAVGNIAAIMTLTLDGGSGNDTILGGNGADVLIGGDGKDFIDGNQGNDIALLGTGNDIFNWDPGDGSDVVEGQDGIDKLQFNGANIAENIDIAANGSRVRLFRDIGSVVMDLNGVERIAYTALGGADAISVHDLTGTDVQNVSINLGGFVGASGGDGSADTVIVDGTSGDDVITVSSANGVITVTGLAWTVAISNFEAGDTLVINGLAGQDVIDATSLSGVQLIENGGEGDDVLIGTAGFEQMFGGDGDDVLIGNGGFDVLDGGIGDNIILP